MALRREAKEVRVPLLFSLLHLHQTGELEVGEVVCRNIPSDPRSVS